MKFRRPTVENKGWTWWLGCVFSLCLLLGAMAYWASIWLAPAVRIAPAGSLSDQSGPMNLAQAQGLFGQMASAPAPLASVSAPSNIKVLGILAAGRKGSAVLTIDGKPGKVFVLGDKVDGQLKLISVDSRQVTLGQEGTTIRQTLAAPSKPDISVLTQGPAKAPGFGGAPPGSNLSSSHLQSPGIIPNPSSPMTPPPSSMLSPPTVINPGQGGQVVTGLPTQPQNSPGSINSGALMPMPATLPPGAANFGPSPGPQPTQ